MPHLLTTRPQHRISGLAVSRSAGFEPRSIIFARVSFDAE